MCQARRCHGNYIVLPRTLWIKLFPEFLCNPHKILYTGFPWDVDVLDMIFEVCRIKRCHGNHICLKTLWSEILPHFLKDSDNCSWLSFFNDRRWVFSLLFVSLFYFQYHTLLYSGFSKIVVHASYFPKLSFTRHSMVPFIFWNKPRAYNAPTRGALVYTLLKFSARCVLDASIKKKKKKKKIQKKKKKKNQISCISYLTHSHEHCCAQHMSSPWGAFFA